MSDSKQDPEEQKKVQTSVPLSLTKGTTHSQIKQEDELADVRVGLQFNDKKFLTPKLRPSVKLSNLLDSFCHNFYISNVEDVELQSADGFTLDTNYSLGEYNIKDKELLLLKLKKSQLRKLEPTCTTTTEGEGSKLLKEVQIVTEEDRMEVLESFISLDSCDRLQEPIKMPIDEFLNRDEGIEAACSAAHENLSSFCTNLQTYTKTQDHNFIFIAGGSGSGKTRAGRQIRKILQDYGSKNVTVNVRKDKEEQHDEQNPPPMKPDDRIFQNTLEIYVDFCNGDRILPEETDESQILGLRLFVHGATCKKFTDFKTFLGGKFQYYLKNKVFECNTVLTCLSRLYHKLLQGVTHIPLVVFLDNYQFVKDKFPRGREWKDVAKTLGRYMCTSDGANARSAVDRLIIIPALAAAVKENDLSFLLTEYGNTIFPLPPFSFDNIQYILEKENMPKNLYDTYEKQRFWYLVGMIPGALEEAIKITNSISEVSDSQEDIEITSWYKKIENRLKHLYGNRFFANVEELSFYCLTGCPVADQQHLIDIVNKGEASLNEKYQIMLPLPHFRQLIAQNTLLLSDLFPLLQSDSNWIQFEKLMLTILQQQLNGTLTYKLVDEIHVKSLFRGVHFAEDLYDVIVKLQSRTTLSFEVESFLTGTCQDFHINMNLNFSTPMIRLCKRNNLLVDGDMETLSIYGEKLLFLFQYKYKYDPGDDKEDQMKPDQTPLGWYRLISKIETLEKTEQDKQIQGVKVIYVYVTSANIPKKAAEAIKECPRLVVIEGSVMKNYVAPNLLPYFKILPHNVEPGEEISSAFTDSPTENEMPTSPEHINHVDMASRHILSPTQEEQSSTLNMQSINVQQIQEETTITPVAQTQTEKTQRKRSALLEDINTPTARSPSKRSKRIPLDKNE